MAVEERTDALEDALQDEEMSAGDIDGSFVPRIMPEVDGVEVDGEAVLLIDGPWSIHWLNQISTVVFGELDGVSSIDQVSERLSKAFQADLEVVRNDVINLTQDLGRAGFLEGVAAEEFQYTSPSMEGLPVGTVVPPFELSDLDGRTVTDEDLRGRQTLLLHWSPYCGFCGKIGPEVAELQPKLRERGVQTMFISIGSVEEVREQLGEFGLDVPVLLQQADEHAEIFDGMGTPVAYLIDAEGKTMSELAFGSDQVPVLLRGAAGISEVGNGAKKKAGSARKSSAKKASSKKAAGSRARARAATKKK
jgi:peroxiredoxin